MEMSVIYTMAKIHQKKCNGLLRIGDLLLQGEEVCKTTDLRRPHSNMANNGSFKIKDISSISIS